MKSMEQGRQRLKTALLIALASRLIPAAFYGHPWDMYIWLKSGELGLSHVNIYLLSNPVDYPWGFYAYPPTWLYWLMVSEIIGRIVGSLNLQVLVIKAPIIASDILIGALLYDLAKRLGFSERRAFIASCIWLFNPITYFMSAIWGMFDSIAALFMLLSLKSILEGRYIRGGAMIGVGTAVKILPALIILPTMIYFIKVKRVRLSEIILKLCLPALAIFLIISTPFLTTPIEYFSRLFYHTKSVGGFTYWMVISAFINLSNFWFIPLLAFAFVMILLYRKIGGRGDYIWACALTFIAFLATSPKVNIQYTIMLLPILLLSRTLWDIRNSMRNFILLMISGLIWLITSTAILYGYSLDYLGRLYIAEVYEIKPEYILHVLPGVFAGTRFIALTMDYLGMKKINMVSINRWSATTFVIIALIGAACIFPPPVKVTLPNADVRIAVPESVDSAFIPRSEKSVDQFLKYFNVNYVVISFSPDFVNTYDQYIPYRDLSKYLRFKIYLGRWSYRDLAWLIDELQERDVKPLLGIYLKAEDVKYHYGVHGFAIDWIKSHPEIIGYRKILLFNSTIDLDGEEIIYADYFSEKVERIVHDFGFEGVYLMAWSDWRITENRIDHIIPLLESLREKEVGEIFVEGADSICDIDSVKKLIERSDYVILKTAPWINSIYYVRVREASITYYERCLRETLSSIPEDDKDKLLFGVYVFDFVDGWFTPALELQMEVNRFHKIGLHKGYSIYHASRYVPYKLKIEAD